MQIWFQMGVQGGEDEAPKTVQPVRQGVEDAADTVIAFESNLQ